MGNNENKLFHEHRIPNTSMQAFYMECENLSALFTELLSDLFDRKIKAESGREDYYYWSISIYKTPITKEELELVFDLAGADELDHEQNNFGEYPIMELCQGLCSKLMDKLLPYTSDYTLADDDGVWFFSSPENNILRQSLPDGTLLVAETSDDPEYPGIRVSARIPGRLETLVCFVEHNREKPIGKELCIGAYSFNQDDPAYYESYNDPGWVSPNV